MKTQNEVRLQLCAGLFDVFEIFSEVNLAVQLLVNQHELTQLPGSTSILLQAKLVCSLCSYKLEYAAQLPVG